MAVIRLGLIGDNIARSHSPRLHVEAGRLCGLDVTYERLIPRDLGLSFDEVFRRCAEEGYRGINITYPYKEQVVAQLAVPDARIRAIGACNTVLFGPGRPEGHNTDHSGFISAFRAGFGAASPGRVAMIGAGGVGKAIAFALSTLGAGDLRIFDRDTARAAALACALQDGGILPGARHAETAEEAAEGADGFLNCTPVGMVGNPGSPIDTGLMRGASWAFDAVYTPIDTDFLRGAEAAGATIVSGYELFFHQGIDAFRHFTGAEVDPRALRTALAAQDDAPAMLSARP